MNEYSQYLKSKLEEVDKYVLHVKNVEPTNIFSDAKKAKYSNFTKNLFWFLGFMIISISVVAFFTQTILLIVDNVSDRKNDSLAVENSNLKNTVPSMVGIEIPGVTRIGYDESISEEALSNNINKYDNNTFVIGGREGEMNAQSKTTVGGGDDPNIQGRYSILPKSYEPVLNSKAYLVADLETGEVIIEKNADTVYPIASVSKLMTALVAREKMDMQTVAIVSRDASKTYGNQGGLILGEKIRLRDLQFPLLMESSNDAAEVFADQFGHAQFIEELNKKAKSLEMNDTYYGDPSGLDPQNTSTPKDLLILARYIMKNDPEIFDMTRVKQFSIKGHTWYNKNPQLLLNEYVGGKNGYIDQAKQTTVSLFDVPLAKGGVRTVVMIILKSDVKNTDVNKLISYLKKSVVYQVE